MVFAVLHPLYSSLPQTLNPTPKPTKFSNLNHTFHEPKLHISTANLQTLNPQLDGSAVDQVGLSTFGNACASGSPECALRYVAQSTASFRFEAWVGRYSVWGFGFRGQGFRAWVDPPPLLIELPSGQNGTGTQTRKSS